MLHPKSFFAHVVDSFAAVEDNLVDYSFRVVVGNSVVVVGFLVVVDSQVAAYSHEGENLRMAADSLFADILLVADSPARADDSLAKAAALHLVLDCID